MEESQLYGWKNYHAVSLCVNPKEGRRRTVPPPVTPPLPPGRVIPSSFLPTGRHCPHLPGSSFLLCLLNTYFFCCVYFFWTLYRWVAVVFVLLRLAVYMQRDGWASVLLHVTVAYFHCCSTFHPLTEFQFIHSALDRIWIVSSLRLSRVMLLSKTFET